MTPAAVALAVTLGLVASPALAVPVTVPIGTGVTLEAPEVGAVTWLVYDDTLDVVLAANGIDEARPMASTTKIMTALLVLEHSDLDDVVTVSETAAIRRGSIIPLYAGERLTVRQLLMALLIRSGNDAALALAEHVAGSVPEFVVMMNLRAIDLGMTQTRFANPNGLDAEGHYSSARDLLILERAAMEYPEFREIGLIRGALLPPHPNGTVRYLRQTNSLVRDGYEGAFAGKTGDTPNADRTFVGGAERNGRRLYVVVMGSKDHMADASALLEHGFVGFPHFSAIARGGAYAINRTGDETSPVAAGDDVTTAGVGEDEIVVVPAIEAGRPVLVASAGERVLGSVPIEGGASIELPGPIEALRWWFDRRTP